MTMWWLYDDHDPALMAMMITVFLVFVTARITLDVMTRVVEESHFSCCVIAR